MPLADRRDVRERHADDARIDAAARAVEVPNAARRPPPKTRDNCAGSNTRLCLAKALGNGPECVPDTTARNGTRD